MLQSELPEDLHRSAWRGIDLERKATEEGLAPCLKSAAPPVRSSAGKRHHRVAPLERRVRRHGFKEMKNDCKQALFLTKLFRRQWR